jgi:hypothetical protein
MSQKLEENPVEGVWWGVCGGNQDSQEKNYTLPERTEEAKLKSDFPSLWQKPGDSNFLTEILRKGESTLS